MKASSSANLLKQVIAHNKLPTVQGKYRLEADLSKMCWFGSGGKAELLFIPNDIPDLCTFLQAINKINQEANNKIPITILGIGSNLLIRDGGIEGVVVRLGRNFTYIKPDKEAMSLCAGAATLDLNVAQEAKYNGMGGLEFLSGIPGTIGGALAMNAGCYGSDIAVVLKKATAVSYQGELRQFRPQEINYCYRGHNLEESFIFVEADFKVIPEDPEVIQQKILDIQRKREGSQPIKSRTSGSTFKNPPGYKAWELIDQAGCRGLRIGGAQVSTMHCNFFINDLNATSADIENLINLVKQRVFLKSGIMLEEEVKIIGKKL